ARYTALMEIEANRPRRLELLAALAEALPNDAHLFSFEAGAEGVRVEGRAQSGATVASALEAAAAFRSALFVAPVRREDTPNGTFERFSLTIEPERDPSVEAKDGQRARRPGEGGAPCVGRRFLPVSGGPWRSVRSSWAGGC